jgi:glycerophosphoryl diester phosphodiesterase
MSRGGAIAQLPLGARILRLAAVLAIANLASASPAPSGAIGDSQDWQSAYERMAHPPAGDILVIAHRACWKEAAENSIAAVQACIAMGVDGVEFDVRHTQDGVAVVMHDETVDRMTEGHGRVSDLTLAQFKALRLRSGAGGEGAPLTDMHPPTLAEYLAASRGRLWIVFDVKDGTQVQTFAEAKAAGVAQQSIFFYECASGLLRDKVNSFWTEAVIFPIVFSRDGPLASVAERCPSHPANLIHAKWSTPGYLEAARAHMARRKERLWIATMFHDDTAGKDDAAALADPAGTWGADIAAGANMIMTNQPGALLRFIKSRSVKSAK